MSARRIGFAGVEETKINSSPVQRIWLPGITPEKIHFRPGDGKTGIRNMTIANDEKWIDKETSGLSEATMDIDLTISADTVRLFAQKARAVASSIQDTFEDGHEGDVEFDADTLEESHSHDGLAEEESEDLSDEELRELIEDLNVDEAANLVAITWIGRGDFEAEDFDQAVTEAKDRAVGSTAKYLLGMPLLADYLEAGLDALDL